MSVGSSSFADQMAICLTMHFAICANSHPTDLW